MTAFNQDYTTATGREAYLAWVDSWKAEYKALSQRIRDNKKAQSERKGMDCSTLQYQRYSLRCDARDMMELRHEARDWSRKQRDAVKEAA